MSVLSSRAEAILLPYLCSKQPLQDVLDTIEKLLNTPVRFTSNEDLSHSVSSSSYPSRDLAIVSEFYSNSNNADEITEKLKICASYFDDTAPRVIIDQATGYRKILNSIDINGYHIGHLAIPEVSVDLDSLDPELIDVVSRYIGLYIMTHSYDSCTREKDILNGLLDGSITTPYNSSIVRHFKLIQNKHFRLYCFLNKTGRPSSMKSLAKVVQSFFPSDFTSIRGESVVLLSIRESRISEPSDLVLIRKIVDMNTCSCCIGPDFIDILQCKKWYDKMLLLPIFQRSSAGEIIDFALCRDTQLIIEARNHGVVLEEYISEIIMDMQAYDKAHKTQYLHTLRAFFASSRSYKATANMLYVHINTVQYRIKRMQELFGFQIDDSVICYQLILSIRILDLIHESR